MSDDAHASGVQTDLGRAHYRPALDGVRAIAVLAVIAYHLGSHLSGGFLGVDIFFVLSGYLITSLLLQQRSRSGSVNLAGFWARRARRLLPALLILVTTVAVVTAHTASVATFPARRADLLSTIFYFANWHFIAVGQSYFAQFSGTSPLEHMWSLSIEEQFYLVWPLVIVVTGWLLRRRPRVFLALILLGAVASAVQMAALYDPVDPTTAYIGTGARASELLIGAALATLLFNNPQLLENRHVHRVAGWGWPLIAGIVGVALIAMNNQSGLYYHGGAFAFALIVAAGLLVVEAMPQSLPARLLSFRPVRWIGMISYGLYLWHWPIIVWGADRALTWDLHIKQAVELLLIFAIATVSFYAVERPIRAGRVPWLRMSRRRLALVLSIAVAITVGVSVSATNVGALARQLADVGGRACPPGSPSLASRFPWCVRATPRTPHAPTVALVGDSTANALDIAMQSLADKRGWGYIQAAQNGCSLLPLMFPANPDIPSDVAFSRLCVREVPQVLAEVAKRYHPNVWLISDRWMHGNLLEPDGHLLIWEDPRRSDIVAETLSRTLRMLTANGAKAIIVIPPPAGPPIECGTKSPPPAGCQSTQFTTSDRQTAITRRLITRVAASMKGTVAAVSIDDLTCPDHGSCPAFIKGDLVRVDGIHFTASFARKILPSIFARAERSGIAL